MVSAFAIDASVVIAELNAVCGYLLWGALKHACTSHEFVSGCAFCARVTATFCARWIMMITKAIVLTSGRRVRGVEFVAWLTCGTCSRACARKTMAEILVHRALVLAVATVDCVLCFTYTGSARLFIRTFSASALHLLVGAFELA